MTVHTKLILLEGLTGSGKSVTAQRIARQLHWQNIEADWYGEQQAAHPTNVDDASDIECFVEKTFEHWTTFMRQTQISGRIGVLDGSLFQSFIRILFHHNVAPERISEYARILESIIAPLDPALIYFHQGDVRSTLQRVCQQRGERWTSGIIDTITSNPYAREHGLTGFDGFVQYWARYQSLIDELLTRSSVAQLVLRMDESDWTAAMPSVYEFLGIVAVPEPTIPDLDLRRYVGTYRDEANGHLLTVRGEDGQLFLDNFIFATSRLLPSGSNVFAVEGWPHDLVFDEDANSIIHTMRIAGRDVDFIALVGSQLQKVG